MNKVILIGNLGQDPEMRNTNSGNAVANLRVATNERKKDPQGQWVDHTEWHSVVVFGRVAENCGQYLNKGSKVAVEGRIQTRKWKDNAGNDRWTTEIVAFSVDFLSTNQNQGQQQGGYQQQGNGGYNNQQQGGYQQGNQGGYQQQGQQQRPPVAPQQGSPFRNQGNQQQNNQQQGGQGYNDDSIPF